MLTIKLTIFSAICAIIGLVMENFVGNIGALVFLVFALCAIFFGVISLIQFLTGNFKYGGNVALVLAMFIAALCIRFVAKNTNELGINLYYAEIGCWLLGFISLMILVGRFIFGTGRSKEIDTNIDDIN